MAGRRTFGVAVLGLGRMGQIHVKNLLATGQVRLNWVMRRRPDTATDMGLLGQARLVGADQYNEILEDKSVQGVVIASSTSEHEQQIKQALQAGKVVFSEKPITSQVNTTQQCFDLAEKHNRPLICAFHRRFDPSFYSVRQNLQANTSGRLRLLRISSHDLSPPPIDYVRTSGGIFKDSTIHDLDMALWMTGSPVTRISVTGQAFHPAIRQAGDLDLVVVTLQHENGAVSVIDNGRQCAHGYDQRLEAICESGSYVVTNRPAHQMYTHSAHASATPPMDQVFDTRYVDAYANEIQHFIEVMAGTAEPRVSRGDVLSAMLLAEGALKSAQTGLPRGRAVRHVAC